MRIGVDQALAVAQLARIDISREEARLVAEQLTTLLEHFEKLAELDTDHVPPTSHALFVRSVLRSDSVVPPDEGESLLREAPQCSGSYFVVPKVID